MHSTDSFKNPITLSNIVQQLGVTNTSRLKFLVQNDEICDIVPWFQEDRVASFLRERGLSQSSFTRTIPFHPYIGVRPAPCSLMVMCSLRRLCSNL